MHLMAREKPFDHGVSCPARLSLLTALHCAAAENYAIIPETPAYFSLKVLFVLLSMTALSGKL